MSDNALTRARGGDERAFGELTDPYRRELQLHCYRIIGSIQDAEDLLQETMLSAWRGLGGFEERASLRAWLYRIATNRSLNALRDSARRPSERAAPNALSFEPPEPTRRDEPLWMEPYPDALLDGIADASPGPDARYELREAVSLAFVSALQRLPPRQRAALVLRDVLGFRAAEVAPMLDASEASINSALQRARATLDSVGPRTHEHAPVPDSPRERKLVSQFADAFESGNVDQVIALLTDDAWVTMPPQPLEYQRPAAISAFLTHAFAVRGDERHALVPTRANRQPALGHYIRAPGDSEARGTGVLVLAIRGDRISQITRFGGEALLAHFGLPRVLT